jgi:hypothetical protein
MTGDARRLADTIECLTRHGRHHRAAEAIEIAEYVEILCDLLLAEIDELLANVKQRRLGTR